MVRSLPLWGLWAWSGERGPGWLQLIPWGLWLWRGLAVGWPGLHGSDLWRWIEQALWQGQRLLVVGYVGRTPFVRQQQMAEWFDVPQPNISRWLRYWLARDWANLLSLHSAEVLTAELVARIVTVLATFPTWSMEQVYQHLRQQGVAVTQAQVQQAAGQSGW